MPIDDVKINGIYRHFKGHVYRVLCIAKDAENDNLQDMVIYKDVEKENNGDSLIWVRPKSLFCSEVDKIKYPNVKQKYRFELIDIVKLVNLKYNED